MSFYSCTFGVRVYCRGMEENNNNPNEATKMEYEFKSNISVNGHGCNVSNWSGNFRPFRGVVINSSGHEVAHTVGCSSKSRALDRAVALARTL